MKKVILAISLALLVMLTAVSAFAAPAAPKNCKIEVVYDFTSLGDQTAAASALGFWTGGGDCEVTVKSGYVSFSKNVWGAFGNFSEKAQAKFKTASGIAFSFRTENAAVITLGFNDNSADGTNHILKKDAECFLYDKDGKQKITTQWNDGFNQGVINVPAGFDGTVFIPFSAYVVNNGSNKAFDVSVSQPNTPIYVVGNGAPGVAFGEIAVYSEGSSQTADVSVFAYCIAAAAALTAAVIAIMRRKNTVA